MRSLTKCLSRLAHRWRTSSPEGLPRSCTGLWPYLPTISRSKCFLLRLSMLPLTDPCTPSRMMATSHTLARPSFLQTARQIHAEGGYRGYFRGLGPTLLRAFPVNASALWVYEGLMRLLGAEKVDQDESSMGHRDKADKPPRLDIDDLHAFHLFTSIYVVRTLDYSTITHRRHYRSMGGYMMRILCKYSDSLTIPAAHSSAYVHPKPCIRHRPIMEQ